MKIAVNTRLLLPGKLEGIGWFSCETLQRICLQHPEDQFFFIFDRAYDERFIFAPNITPIVLSPQARHPILYYFWFGFRLPALLKKLKPDLFLSPDGYLPLSFDGPCLAVFHDLNFEHHPKDLPKAERWFYRHFFPRYARKATRIATVSQYSKQDIATLYKLDPQKIDVVYNGVHEAYKPLDTETSLAVRLTYSEGLPYFLFVGSIHPRKNLARLFLAYDSFRQQHPENTKLLVVGAKKWWTPAIKQAYENMHFKADVLFIGRLPVEELSRVMAAALALTYISYFEGFGIPLLEAFACHTPVITANITSMPEIAGDAALLIDPFSVPSIAEAMLQIANDGELRSKLIEQGAIRVRDFSWERSAALLYQSIINTTESYKA